jgi:hypothetical protein
MNDYQLGAALRERVLQARAQQQPVDGRRLQSLVGDLCGADQSALLPALRHLVLSAGFHSAAGQTPPLADPRLAPRLMAELQEVFAPALCRRMEAVVRGLLALPAPAGAPTGAPAAAVAQPAVLAEPIVVAEPAAAAAVAAVPPVVSVPPAEPAEPPSYAAEPAAPRRSSGALVALLAFLTGSLSVAVVGLVLWMRQLQTPPLPTPADTAQLGTPSRPQPPTTTPTPEPPAVPQLPEPTPEEGGAQVAEAIRSVQALYAALSRREFEQARQFFSGEAADQFDPAFFEQFARVEVSSLESRGSNGSSVTLQGIVTFVYPDGTSQSETRIFTLDTATSPALITGSAFGQVLQPRT